MKWDLVKRYVLLWPGAALSSFTSRARFGRVALEPVVRYMISMLDLKMMLDLITIAKKRNLHRSKSVQSNKSRWLLSATRNLCEASCRRPKSSRKKGGRKKREQPSRFKTPVCVRELKSIKCPRAIFLTTADLSYMTSFYDVQSSIACSLPYSPSRCHRRDRVCKWLSCKKIHSRKNKETD